MNFKRLNQLHSPHAGRSAPPSAAMIELHALLQSSFGELLPEDLPDLFVWPSLETHDPNRVVENVFAEGDDNDGPDWNGSDTKDLYRRLIEQSPKQPIFIIGHVGVGKSTLMRYTFSHLLDCDGVFPIFLDFKEVRSETDAISKFVIDYIDRRLTEELSSDTDDSVAEEVFLFLQPARRKQLENLAKLDANEAEISKSIALQRLQNDREAWNQARLQYISQKHNKRVCVIFDNVDHHMDPGFIQKTIAEAMMQSAANKCQLLMTLRPYNLGAAYERAAYAASPFTLIRVNRADITELLKRRMEKALKKCQGKNFTSFTLSNGIRMKAPDYLALLVPRLQSLINPTVVDILGGVAGSNFRRLLLCIRHVFSMNALSHHEALVRNTLSRYDVLESVLRTSGSAYVSPEMDAEAVVMNVYENELPNDPGNNLIRVRVLQCVSYYGRRAINSVVLSDLERFGYNKERVKDVLERFHAQGLVEHGDSSEILYSVDYRDFSHQLTTSGVFYLEDLIYEYRYALAVKEDMYFPPDDYERIVGSSTFSERTLDQRQQEIEAFDAYLERQEQEEERRCQYPQNLRSMFPCIARRMRTKHEEAIKRLRSAQQHRTHDAEGARGRARQD